jgi:hypothetical protein
MGVDRTADSRESGGCCVNDATLLHRQISPSWLQLGRVTSQAFKPTPKDMKRLSLYDGDQITAGASGKHYTTELKLTSIGVLAITVAECGNQALPVDPDGVPFASHVSVRFDACSNSQIEKKPSDY